MIRVAINGFGRIGRSFFRSIFNDNNFKIVVINDLSDLKVISHLLKYDSIHGRFPEKLSHDKKNLIIGEKKIPVINYSKIELIPWKEYNVDLVIEATGKYLTRPYLKKED